VKEDYTEPIWSNAEVFRHMSTSYKIYSKFVLKNKQTKRRTGHSLRTNVQNLENKISYENMAIICKSPTVWHVLFRV